MLFEQKEVEFQFFDDRAIPEQWEFANCGLLRLISVENNESNIWNDTLNQYLEAPITQSDHLESQTAILQIKEKKKSSIKRIDTNYEKNICAYITKKAVQYFLAKAYRRKVEKLCQKLGCKYAQAQEYYGQRYKQVFGITHLALLITPQQENEKKMKKVFIVFMRWFLREKYMIYLLKNGKMSQKEKYIEFKNKYILYINKIDKQL